MLRETHVAILLKQGSPHFSEVRGVVSHARGRWSSHFVYWWKKGEHHSKQKIRPKRSPNISFTGVFWNSRALNWSRGCVRDAGYRIVLFPVSSYQMRFYPESLGPVQALKHSVLLVMIFTLPKPLKWYLIGICLYRYIPNIRSLLKWWRWFIILENIEELKKKIKHYFL